MNQQFEDEVMQDLGADSPRVSADSGLDEGSYQDGYDDDGFAEDGFETDGMDAEGMLEEADQFDSAGEDYGDENYLGENGYEDGYENNFGDEFADELEGEFAEAEYDALDALEEAVANAMDAEDSDEFLSNLIRGIRAVAGVVSRGAGTVNRVAGTVNRVAGRVQRTAGQVRNIAEGVQGLVRPAAPQQRRRVARRPVGPVAPSAAGMPALLQQLLPLLRQHAAQGADELELFEELADWFEEEDADAALPVLAGLAARTALRPLVRQGGGAIARGVRRQLVRGAAQAARNLVRRQGPRAVRALRPIARSVGRAAARNRLRPAALPAAIRQTANRVAAQPRLARRLSQTPGQAIGARGSRNRPTLSGGMPRRLVVRGPVEIIFRR